MQNTVLIESNLILMKISIFNLDSSSSKAKRDATQTPSSPDVNDKSKENKSLSRQKSANHQNFTDGSSGMYIRAL